MAYLYEKQNRHAPRRANGRRFWGYPGRNAAVSAIVIHAAEGNWAANVASYQSTTDRPSSYHTLVDWVETIVMLPPEATAFGARGHNSHGLHLSFACFSSSWGDDLDRDEQMLVRGAAAAADWCRRYDIPVRLITRAQASRGVKGFAAHGTLDPTRRTDPGDDFPWSRFFELVRAELAGTTRPTDPLEALMSDLTKAHRATLERLAELTPAQLEAVVSFAEAIESERSKGGSFVRQLLVFHRTERPLLRGFLRAAKESGSSPRGIGRYAPLVIRAATHKGWPLDDYTENRKYPVGVPVTASAPVAPETPEAP